MGGKSVGGACLSVFLLLAGAATAFAQAQGNGILTGTVVDNVGVVPGVTITATDRTNGLVRTATSNEQGLFQLVALPPGKYSLKITMEAFKQIEMEVPVLSGETRDLGKITLQAGGRTETITVTAEVTPVQTSSSSLQKNLSSDLITSVQVKGRDIFGLLKILPGVVDTTASRDFAQWSSGRGLAINGGSSLNKNTTIDGVPVGEEGGDGTTHITPNIDALQEVNVITSGYTAENGRQASGQVNMTTKSGTNQFKGSGWYNYRRDWMNKNDYFRIKQGAAKPFFAVNIGGFSVGGPVIIPKVINSRTSEKKVFWFASEELTNDIRPTAISRVNLPTALERQGDFSQTYYCTNTATNPCTALRNADGSIQTLGSAIRLNLVNPRPTEWPDFFIGDNKINPKYFNAMGARMLNLLPDPNLKYNPQQGNAFASNDAQDTLPIHKRKNFVARVDTTLTPKTRFSVRVLMDRDDSTTFNRTAPGIGSVDNMFPGNLVTGTLTKVIRPSVVNEATIGWSQNHWGFKARQGGVVASDYTPFYRQNIVLRDGTVGLNPPRLAPYLAYGDPHLGKSQADQYPYLPDISFGGGNYANYSQYRPSGGSGPLPRQNENYRFTIQDDLSIVKGRHNFKFGFATERDSKTEPGSNDYNGVYNFGHNGDNPLSTGNGYANALLGIFTEYSERDRRVDAEILHWLTEGYLQDSWRLSPRFTLDYGLRMTHNGTLYEVRNQNSAFDPSLYKLADQAILFKPYCTTGVPGNLSCGSSARRAINPVTGEVVSQAFAGRQVPGKGSITNGMFLNGISGMKRPGQYFELPLISWGPRVGFAWDVFGDGKTAIRGSGGIFYNFVNRGLYGFNGGPLVSRTRQILNATIDDIPLFVASGNLAESPQGIRLSPEFYDKLSLPGQTIKPDKLQAERHYQGNFAVQRDIGFHTVVEAAWVGNFGRHYWRAKSTNNIPVYAYANPANLFNGEAIAANFIRRDYPGVGPISYLTSDDVGLDYNALQVSVQRRLSKGLQMGMAYTLAKAKGMQDWDFVTEELYGAAGLRDRYYGPPARSQTQDRRHILVVNYSYAIPTPFKGNRILAAALGNWEASGVTSFQTGDPVTPSCGGSNLSGVANNDPSLSGVGVRCEFVPGQSLLTAYDPNPTGTAAIEDQAHFNLAALQRPRPDGGVGNLGNTGFGILRSPSWSNWDFTLARRLPIKIGRGGNARIQIQFYNLFNQVEFNQLGATYSFNSTGVNTNTNTGKYTNTQNPFNGSVTIRIDY